MYLDGGYRETGYWHRSMVETEKLDDGARVVDLKDLHTKAPFKIIGATQEDVELCVEGSFLIWGGIVKEAVTERVSIGAERVWELTMPFEALEEIKLGIKLGVLNVNMSHEGVVGLKEFAVEESPDVEMEDEPQWKIEDILDHLPSDATSAKHAEVYLVDWGVGDWDDDNQYHWMMKDDIGRRGQSSLPITLYW